MRSVCRCVRGSQDGASLIVSLLMLVAVLVLSISAASIALQSEKASRNDRDRQIALQAAEAALMDAELDIEGSPDKSKSRSALFGKDYAEGFIAGCGAGSDNPFQGLCQRSEEGGAPVWQSVDFADESDNARSVPHGRFTGHVFQTGQGSLPAKPPRYIIELMHYTGAAASAGEDMTFFYRVTAVGFGMQPTTQVALQTFYRKESR